MVTDGILELCLHSIITVCTETSCHFGHRLPGTMPWNAPVDESPYRTLAWKCFTTNCWVVFCTSLKSSNFSDNFQFHTSQSCERYCVSERLWTLNLPLDADSSWGCHPSEDNNRSTLRGQEVTYGTQRPHSLLCLAVSANWKPSVAMGPSLQNLLFVRLLASRCFLISVYTGGTHRTVRGSCNALDTYSGCFRAQNWPGLPLFWPVSGVLHSLCRHNMP
jgi:hypothetical protein